MTFEIVKLTNFQNFAISRINKLLEFFPIFKIKIRLKKLAKFGIGISPILTFTL